MSRLAFSDPPSAHQRRVLEAIGLAVYGLPTIGSAPFAVAFSISGDRILKITDRRSDALAFEKIQELDPEGALHVYSVRQIVLPAPSPLHALNTSSNRWLLRTRYAITMDRASAESRAATRFALGAFLTEIDDALAPTDEVSAPMWGAELHGTPQTFDLYTHGRWPGSSIALDTIDAEDLGGTPGLLSPPRRQSWVWP